MTIKVYFDSEMMAAGSDPGRQLIAIEGKERIGLQKEPKNEKEKIL